jgi:hypothetical protein
MSRRSVPRSGTQLRWFQTQQLWQAGRFAKRRCCRADNAGDVGVEDSPINPNKVMVPPPPGFSEGAFLGLNDFGVMVGMAFNNDNNEQTAFISTDGMTSTNLNSQIGDPSWVLSEAQAINSAGQIAGAGYLNGVQTGFLLTPLPTPAPWQSVQIDALLELIYVSLGVMVDGGGPTSGGPVDP